MPDLTDLFAQPVTFSPGELQDRVHILRSDIARQAMTARVEAGECPGIAPIGYRNTVVEGRRTVVIDPQTAPLIIEAFRLATTKHSSLRKILMELTPRGLVGRAGRPMSVSSLQHVLTNPFYAGLIRHGDKLHRGAHQPLISKTLLDRVHQRLFRRRCR